MVAARNLHLALVVRQSTGNRHGKFGTNINISMKTIIRSINLQFLLASHKGWDIWRKTDVINYTRRSYIHTYIHTYVYTHTHARNAVAKRVLVPGHSRPSYTCSVCYIRIHFEPLNWLHSSEETYRSTAIDFRASNRLFQIVLRDGHTLMHTLTAKKGLIEIISPRIEISVRPDIW